MVQYKKQLDAVMRCLTAETEEDRKNAQQEIRELLDGAERTAGKQDAETLVRDILVDIGVPEHLVGHPYLVTAICMAVYDGTCLKKITSDLYPTVAMTYGTTPSRAERAIRHAIEVAWDRCDLEACSTISETPLAAPRVRPRTASLSRGWPMWCGCG